MIIFDFLTDPCDVISAQSVVEAPPLGENRRDSSYAVHARHGVDAYDVGRAARLPVRRGTDGGRGPGQLRGWSRDAA